ncbi:hypothetical protein ACTI_30390 [Actinoplanes sp. OR16]|uniref:hypothetical protein n=1 Tax=Actinoplanes sp. OR16 TaxID=946334 RepID=UPI000F70F287|nr:hypothetical protein [Actinoplanes sp. OR16]BBH66354.1 hypothetical protein ACTI_30390 [Actinoplanes sp. OR16]
MIALIVACEIGFWALLSAGLFTRYVLKWPRLSAALLIAVPVVDVLLLVATAIDLRRGAEPALGHGLAAVYLAVTVVFGHRMIRWADARFAHRFAGGPPPKKAPRGGREHAARERRAWLEHLLAYVLGAAFLAVFTVIGGGLDNTAPLWNVMGTWSLVLAIDFLISFSYTLHPRKP